MASTDRLRRELFRPDLFLPVIGNRPISPDQKKPAASFYSPQVHRSARHHGRDGRGVMREVSSSFDNTAGCHVSVKSAEKLRLRFADQENSHPFPFPPAQPSVRRRVRSAGRARSRLTEDVDDDAKPRREVMSFCASPGVVRKQRPTFGGRSAKPATTTTMAVAPSPDSVTIPFSTPQQPTPPSSEHQRPGGGRGGRHSAHRQQNTSGDGGAHSAKKAVEASPVVVTPMAMECLDCETPTTTPHWPGGNAHRGSAHGTLSYPSSPNSPNFQSPQPQFGRSNSLGDGHSGGGGGDGGGASSLHEASSPGRSQQSRRLFSDEPGDGAPDLMRSVVSGGEALRAHLAEGHEGRHGRRKVTAPAVAREPAARPSRRPLRRALVAGGSQSADEPTAHGGVHGSAHGGPESVMCPSAPPTRPTRPAPPQCASPYGLSGAGAPASEFPLPRRRRPQPLQPSVRGASRAEYCGAGPLDLVSPLLRPSTLGGGGDESGREGSVIDGEGGSRDGDDRGTAGTYSCDQLNLEPFDLGRALVTEDGDKPGGCGTASFDQMLRGRDRGEGGAGKDGRDNDGDDDGDNESVNSGSVGSAPCTPRLPLFSAKVNLRDLAGVLGNDENDENESGCDEEGEEDLVPQEDLRASGENRRATSSFERIDPDNIVSSLASSMASSMASSGSSVLVVDEEDDAEEDAGSRPASDGCDGDSVIEEEIEGGFEAYEDEDATRDAAETSAGAEAEAGGDAEGCGGDWGGCGDGEATPRATHARMPLGLAQQRVQQRPEDPSAPLALAPAGFNGFEGFREEFPERARNGFGEGVSLDSPRPCFSPPAHVASGVALGTATVGDGFGDPLREGFQLSADLEVLVAAAGPASGGSGLGGLGGGDDDDDDDDSTSGDASSEGREGGRRRGGRPSGFSPWGSESFRWEPLVVPRVPRPRKQEMMYFDPSLAALPEEAAVKAFTRSGRVEPQTAGAALAATAAYVEESCGGGPDGGPDDGVPRLDLSATFSAAAMAACLAEAHKSGVRVEDGDEGDADEPRKKRGAGVAKKSAAVTVVAGRGKQPPKKPPKHHAGGGGGGREVVRPPHGDAEAALSPSPAFLSPSSSPTSLSSSLSSSSLFTVDAGASAAGERRRCRDDTYGRWMQAQCGFTQSKQQRGSSAAAIAERTAAERCFALLRRKAFDELDRVLALPPPDGAVTGNGAGGGGGGCSGWGVDGPRDDHGNTLLLAAVHGGSKRAVRWCLSSGADAKSANRFGNTALHFAVELGLDKVARHLLAPRFALDLKAANARGLTAFERLADLP